MKSLDRMKVIQIWQINLFVALISREVIGTSSITSFYGVPWFVVQIVCISQRLISSPRWNIQLSFSSLINCKKLLETPKYRVSWESFKKLTGKLSTLKGTTSF